MLEAGLVANVAARWIRDRRTRLEHCHGTAGFGEPACNDSADGSTADDHDVATHHAGAAAIAQLDLPDLNIPTNVLSPYRTRRGISQKWPKVAKHRRLECFSEVLHLVMESGPTPGPG